LQTIPSKFSCATIQKPSKYFSFLTLFSAHGDIVVGFALFHIVLFQKKKTKGKKKRKGTPPWYVKVGGHPMESVSHGL
jgi:hypothetical protein